MCREKERPTGAEWAEGRAFATEQTSVPVILSQEVTAKECASRFLHDPEAPFFDAATRRLHALGALYLGGLLSDCEPWLHYDVEILILILRSALRVRRGTAMRIIETLFDAGMLVVDKDTEGGVANE